MLRVQPGPVLYYSGPEATVALSDSCEGEIGFCSLVASLLAQARQPLNSLGLLVAFE